MHYEEMRTCLCRFPESFTSVSQLKWPRWGPLARWPQSPPLWAVALGKGTFTSTYEPAGPGKTHVLKCLQPVCKVCLFIENCLLWGCLVRLLSAYVTDIQHKEALLYTHSMVSHTYLAYCLKSADPFSNVSWNGATYSNILLPFVKNETRAYTET